MRWIKVYKIKLYKIKKRKLKTLRTFVHVPTIATDMPETNNPIPNFLYLPYLDLNLAITQDSEPYDVSY